MMENSYEPAEDTFLLADVVRRYSGKIALEIGMGSGYITSEICKRNPFVVGTEISKKALKDAQIRLKSLNLDNFELILCNGASPFREGCFDLIVFNPPYLPSSKLSDKTVDGGKEGIEVIKRFIDQSSRVISESGLIIFVLSTLSKYNKITKMLKKMSFKVRKICKRKLFFEKIFVIEASKIT
ncbi:MAG: methyltransferase [archaeon]|nr:methyltransferase [archaeon]